MIAVEEVYTIVVRRRRPSRRSQDMDSNELNLWIRGGELGREVMSRGALATNYRGAWGCSSEAPPHLQRTCQINCPSPLSLVVIGASGTDDV